MRSPVAVLFDGSDLRDGGSGVLPLLGPLRWRWPLALLAAAPIVFGAFSYAESLPAEYGHTTALVITDAPDVVELGRRLTGLLGLVGVAKLDFKRAPGGRLHLLEVNPRFNLWHFAGAKAGVNLPALVWADLTGRPRPDRRPARAGVTWCRLWTDFRAARAAGIALRAWGRWLAGCDALAVVAWDDPAPFLRGEVWQRVKWRVGSAPAGPADLAAEMAKSAGAQRRLGAEGPDG